MMKLTKRIALLSAALLVVAAAATACTSNNETPADGSGGSNLAGTGGSGEGLGGIGGETAGTPSGGSSPMETLPPTASSGCGIPAEPGYTRHRLRFGGGYAHGITVPEGYTGNEAKSLVLVYPGNGSTALATQEYFGKHLESFDQGESIFVYIQDGNPRYDLPHFDELYKTITENYCIDTDRVFATAFSAGASFLGFAACERSDILKAVAPVAGERPLFWGCEMPIFIVMDMGAWFDFPDEVALGNGCSTTRTELDPTPDCQTYGEYQGCGDFPVVYCESGIPHGYDQLHAKKTIEFFRSVQ